MNSQIDSKLPKDNNWRPITSIRAKAIALANNENRLLVCEVLNDAGVLKGWCPLGGGIEFGETAENALKREIREELGCGLQTIGPFTVFENIFDHHGYLGHEIVFAFPVTFDSPEIYAKERFQIFEARGSTHWAEWLEIDLFRTGQAVLFPEGILSLATLKI